MTLPDCTEQAEKHSPFLHLARYPQHLQETGSGTAAAAGGQVFCISCPDPKSSLCLMGTESPEFLSKVDSLPAWMGGSMSHGRVLLLRLISSLLCFLRPPRGVVPSR